MCDVFWGLVLNLSLFWEGAQIHHGAYLKTQLLNLSNPASRPKVGPPPPFSEQMLGVWSPSPQNFLSRRRRPDSWRLEQEGFFGSGKTSTPVRSMGS